MAASTSHRQGDIVGNRHTRLISQHRDEVGRPNSAAGGDAGQRQPSEEDASSRGAGSTEKADADETGEETNTARQHDQTKVMLARQTRDHTKHALPTAKLSKLRLSRLFRR
jgi:hypothetical protein